ncbi:MAG: flagellin lysine-N-methylase [Terracidiphilus sp.]
MSRTGLVAPKYTEDFVCIGSACEDNCCHSWGVPITRSAYEKYQTLPESPLRTLIDASILLAPKGAVSSDGFGPEGFAKIRLNESGDCPIMTADGLCQIHAQCGPSFLSSTCATYPRMLRSVRGAEQNALALSCPEAARIVLLNPLTWKPVEPHPPTGGETYSEDLPNSSVLWAIRSAVLNIVRNRAYPLWQRLLHLGVLCEQLDALPRDWPEDEVSKCLDDFDQTIADGTLRLDMESLSVDPSAQLDAVLRLAGLMGKKSIGTPRFVECIDAFKTGIGYGPTATTLEPLTAGYKTAHDRFFAPFFARHPHILENYLINTILRCRFPFGPDDRNRDTVHSATREFTTLIAQFSLMRGLLVGVAGAHRGSFSTEHVVQLVQAASKHFDHHPEFPKLAHDLLVKLGLDRLNGAALLIRNQKSDSRARGKMRSSNVCPIPEMRFSAEHA